MVAPAVTGVTPNEGRSLGVTFVQIDGSNFNLPASGTVRVFFDNQEATEVQVVNSSQIFCLTPRFIQDVLPSPVDLRVENVTPQPDPNPPLVESTTVAGAFTYRRPAIGTNDYSKNACVVKINQSILREFRRYVLENTVMNTHPEYVSPESAVNEEEQQSKSPSVKILGPSIQEDLFYREHGRVTVDQGGGVFEIFDEPVTVQLEYSYVCVGPTSGVVLNLWEQVTKYFQRTPDLQVPIDGQDVSNGFVTYEQGVVFEQRAEVQPPSTRQGVYQAVGSFLLRGVPLLADKIGESREVLEVIVDPQPLL